MDAHLDPSDILNLFTGEYTSIVWHLTNLGGGGGRCFIGPVGGPFSEFSAFTMTSLIFCTDLAEKKAMDVCATIKIAQETIHTLQVDLARKEC
jgi:hypothetical protein